MSKVKVLISDALSPAAVKIFQDRGIDVTQKTGMKPDEIAAMIGDFDGLAIRSSTKVTKDLLTHAKKLRVVGRAGIGVDNVDVPSASAKGVVVMNTPFGNSITTAEHAIAMMFALARQIPEANASTHAGKWEKSKFMGVELSGKMLGIIGCGNIGAIVANRALGLHMKVLAFDPFLSAARAIELGVEKVELDDLLARADFITLHTPMTEQTKGILNATTIAKCKKGVRIINCARGGLVVEEDLVAALQSGHVGGAAFDVFTEEPAKTNPLFNLPNVVCTPHLGASTNEAQENVALQVAEQMSDYLLSGAVTNALNMPSVSAEDAPRLKPYMKLGEQLGAFAGQILEGELKSISLEYEGHAATLNMKPVTAAAVMGVLHPLMDSVNMVNAPVVARERGINISETKRDQASNYHTIVRLIVQTSERTRCFTGTLFGNEKPRLVGIEDVAFEVEMAGRMIYVRNEDKPGFIGRLGTALGDAGVNIANFNLGRDLARQSAIALITVDSDLSADLMAKLNKLPGVMIARNLRF
jgi:D-3-phosphoglycerate dehydrogenase / 2-oxoglutarate reductase